MKGQFNARISRLERFFSLKTSTGQFDPRIDRLERTVNLKECTGQFDDRIDRLERFLNEQTGENSYTGDIVRFYASKSVPLSSAEVSLSPQQDLNGYDSPWPGGGGANKIAWNDGIDFTLKGVRYYVSGGKLYLDGTSSGETSSADATFEANFKFKLPAGTYYFTRGDYPNSTYLVHKVNGATVGIVTNSGEFTLAAEDEVWVGFYVYNKTFSNLHVPIQIVQGSTAPTTYSPYSNICPISGHTGAELIRTGKNLVGAGNIVYGEGYDGNGNTEVNANRFRTEKIACYGKTAIALSWTNGTVSSQAIRVIWDKYGNVLKRTIPSATRVGTRKYYVTNLTNFNPAYCVAFAFYSDGGAPAANNVSEIMCEFVDSPSDYEPYQGDTYSVTFTDQGTVYGGTFDFVTGKLRVTWAKKSFRWGDVTAATDLNYVTRKVFSLDAKPKYPPDDGGQLSSIAPLDVNFSNDTLHFYCNTGGANGQCIMFLPIGTDDNTTFDVAYELATPLEYTLSAQQIETLLGENNVWSDAGEITVKYNMQMRGMNA